MTRHAVLLASAISVAAPAFAANPPPPAATATPAPAAKPAATTPGLSADAPAAPPIQLPIGPVPVPPSDAARKEARTLGEQIGFSNQGTALLGSIRVQIVQQFARVNNKPADEVVKIVDELLMPDMQAQLPKLNDAIIDVWASNFSVDEMKQIQEFYKTPTGEKLLKALPIIQQQVLAAGKTWAEPLFQATIKAHAEELTKRGIKV